MLTEKPSVQEALLFALKNLLAVQNGEGGTAYPAGEIARSAIARAEGRDYVYVVPLYHGTACPDTVVAGHFHPDSTLTIEERVDQMMHVQSQDLDLLNMTRRAFYLGHFEAAVTQVSENCS